ncbi:MAG: hypothetical protein HOY69_07660, partial [Streptomyces sp.]|nr:hypothetical protein [Streptomyces sp.]
MPEAHGVGGAHKPQEPRTTHEAEPAGAADAGGAGEAAGVAEAGGAAVAAVAGGAADAAEAARAAGVAEAGGVNEGHASARRPSGELEASVLAALWAADGRSLTPADVQRDLVAALGADLARTTVTTILARLHDKGAVSRTRAGRGYAYLPAQDPPGLAARRMRTELDKSAEGQRGTVLARFVSELD